MLFHSDPWAAPSRCQSRLQRQSCSEGQSPSQPVQLAVEEWEGLGQEPSLASSAFLECGMKAAPVGVLTSYFNL
jgi:hypothetical protein